MLTSMTESEIIQRADERHRAELSNGSRRVVFRYALDRGWITEQDFEQARRHYGRLWEYTGD